MSILATSNNGLGAYLKDRRTKLDPEYELMDTGIFDDDRYWIVEVHYAKASPLDILMSIQITNAGPEADGVTVAVNVTAAPGAEVRADDTTAMVVAIASARLPTARGPSWPQWIHSIFRSKASRRTARAPGSQWIQS